MAKRLVISLIVIAILFTSALLAVGIYGAVSVYRSSVAPQQLTLVSVAVSTVTPVATMSKAEVEYYRGIFDVCMYISEGDAVRCLAVVEKTLASDWYGEVSNGWSDSIVLRGK